MKGPYRRRRDQIWEHVLVGKPIDIAFFVIAFVPEGLPCCGRFCVHTVDSNNAILVSYDPSYIRNMLTSLVPHLKGNTPG